ncbi:MAG TPA: 16S rRNA (guanine(966)-N(2))-methyltransferase RsmD [Clostridiaceae bacterium]|nr:16S rRNA (guanine(966)-N(2))-methyltransferase RsmD [Clostridiaceae bacterium]
MTRIISGKAKGVRLLGLPGDKVQPTAGRTKEALFSILSSRQISGAFLDLFSGSGQIGLEAASRHFRPVVLIENSRAAQRVIRRNIENTKLNDDVTLLCSNVNKALAKLNDSGQKFDVAFMDPPWKLAIDYFHKLAQPISELLNSEGLLILEHHKNVESPETVTVLEYLNSCKYGSAMLSFYKKAVV